MTARLTTLALLLIFGARVGRCASTPSHLLEGLSVIPSQDSIDYVFHQTQFQLQNLVTEQRHPKTWNLSFQAKKSTAAALEQLFQVDEDVTRKVEQFAGNSSVLLLASQAIENAIIEHKKIYFYGCGATGRLAKQIESSFWRPFWEKVRRTLIWQRIQSKYSGIEGRLIGEMTGGDRALISSLPGFEDLQLIGRLQLKDRSIQKGDVVFAVTEGGETSSVIGTILGAAEQYGKLSPGVLESAQEHLYFVYNNPDAVLLPLDRSRSVLENPGITKIGLFTGPQAVSGSTRMQATTSEMFVLGVVLENAIYQVLKEDLSPTELREVGFVTGRTLPDRLRDFAPLQKTLHSLKNKIVPLTDAEASAYSREHFSTYLADQALMTVFTDSTERSPTFHLIPLDTVDEPHRKSWIQVWSPAPNAQSAWELFLHRSFRGLDPALYLEPFRTQIPDPFLKESAVKSLREAGDDQKKRYDFSFSPAGILRAGPQKGDLGVLVLLSPEIGKLEAPESPVLKWLALFHQHEAPVFAILLNNDSDSKRLKKIQQKLRSQAPESHALILPVAFRDDPLLLREHVGLKMLLNAHSTEVMAKLGKLVGNTMTSVKPSNRKLIGRATYLIQSHTNDVISQPDWVRQHGKEPPVTYAEANAVLFDAVRFTHSLPHGESVSEVSLAIVRLLEFLSGKRNVTWSDAAEILGTEDLGEYLLRQNPKLGG